MLNLKNTILLFALTILGFTACKSSKETAQVEDQIETRSSNNRGNGREKPNMDEMFAKMDVDQDGKLSKLEVDKRLAENFDTIDSNSDGFITKEELKNAPKPERGGRGGRGGRGQ